MRNRAVIAVAVLAFLASTTVSEEPAAPPVPSKPAEATPLSMEALLVRPEELPEGVRIVEGIHAVSPQPKNFYDSPHPWDQATPEMRERFPQKFWDSIQRPKAKACQSLAGQGGVPGSVFLFEYAEDARGTSSFLTGLLWGAKGKGEGEGDRSDRHPEELIVRDRFVIILSFPRGDPAAEWFKDRLRRKFRIPALRYRPEVVPLLNDIMRFFNMEDIDGGLRLLEANAKAIEGYAIGQHFLGEFGLMKRDWATAERGYRKAIALHDGLEDPIEEALYWAALDGLGAALLNQSKLDEAVQILRRAQAFAKGKKFKDDVSVSTYNLACAFALQKSFADCLTTLREASPRTRSGRRAPRRTRTSPKPARGRSSRNS